jgi:hypothetical protein
MPTVRTIGALRFFFYSDEGREPPHVHVEKAGEVAKFWLSPVSLAYPGRWKVHELRRAQELVWRHQHEFLRAWRDYFHGDR